MTFTLVSVAVFALVADAGHVLTQSCDLFDSRHTLVNSSASIVEYHWQKTKLAERSKLVEYALEHTAHYAQNNHRCSREALTKQAAVRLVVDAVRTCPCDGSSRACSTLSFTSDAAREAALRSSLARKTRLFIGDSRMSGDARTFLQLLAAHCSKPLVFGGGFDYTKDTRANFVARCQPWTQLVGHLFA